jgi:hypothetical protein
MSKPAKMHPPLQVIETGELAHANGNKIPFDITHGWSAKTSLQCDVAWKTGWLELLERIEKVEPDKMRQVEILASISMEDLEWRWFDKAIYYTSDEYEWFHLHANGKPQAACLIYHPKPSALGKGDIFYVEFVAVAPWNRECSIRPRELRGAGKAILRAALRFAVKTLKLRPGFCLHSLPKAEGFYTTLKMVNVPGKEKDLMLYFELPEALATQLMGVG